VAKRKEQSDYLRRISENMSRLVELRERSPEQKMYEQAEAKVIKEEKKEQKEEKKSKDKRDKLLKAATIGRLPGPGGLTQQLAQPFVSTYEKNVMLEAAAAGSVASAGGLAENLGDVTEALYKAAHSLELTAIKGTQATGESLFGSAVEAGIISPQAAIEMFKDVKGGIFEAKRQHAEYSKLVAQEVAGKRGVAGVVETIMDKARVVAQNPDTLEGVGRGTE